MSTAVINSVETKHDQLRPCQKSDGMILFIDPLPSSASITASNLTFWGYTVDVVHSFNQALELLKMGELIPDLIFADILNPLHLKQALRFPGDVRKETMWANIPIIARSAMKEKATILKVLKAGYSDYIVATLEKDVLKDRVDKVFHKTIGINPMTFPKPISASGSLVTDIHLASINEFGLEGFANTEFPNQTIFALQSEILDGLGLDQILVKIVGCQEINEGEWKYKLAMSFVGLSPVMQQRIRQFAIANKDKNHFAKKGQTGFLLEKSKNIK